MSSPLQSTLLGLCLVLAVFSFAAAEDFEANCLPKPGEDCGVYKPYSFKLSVSPVGGYNSKWRGDIRLEGGSGEHVGTRPVYIQL